MFTVIIPTTLTAGSLGNPYHAALTASGGKGSYQFTVTGTLPPGLGLSGSGVLSGTSTSAGTFAFTVTADDVRSFGIQNYSLVIETPGLTLTL